MHKAEKTEVGLCDENVVITWFPVEKVNFFDRRAA